MKKPDRHLFSRRSFLKASGIAGVAAGGTGIGFWGYKNGQSPHSHSGWESYQGAAQYFNREAFAVEKPTYKKVGPTRRIDARTEVIFYRFPELNRQWQAETGLDSLQEPWRDYYSRKPQDLELDLRLKQEILPKYQADQEKHADQFRLATAWARAMGAVAPEPVNQPPEISDFPRGERYGEPSTPLPMKDPGKTSALIKQIAYQLGSTLVGIARLNPDWVYLYPMRNRGFETHRELKVPAHWQTAIVVGTPMSWEPFFANPNYGASDDGYARSRIAAFRLAAFIRSMGYAARPHTPGTAYDLIVPPILVDAGLGEQGRHSIVITPELGSNFRPSIVTTNLPLAPDKPIDFGVQDFCKTCKICAKQCPSGAITMGAPSEHNGYLRYQLDISKCHNFWYSKLGNIGCRVCVAVCPYSRKANWVHKSALQMIARDPSKLSHKLLTRLQESFYPAPAAQDYYMPSLGGANASYREAPWWLRSEDFIGT